MGYCFENNRLYCFPNPRWRLEKSDQSGIEIGIQDGGAHESRPCWKTAHQPQRRTGIGLTDFHGDTNHARVFAKMSRNFKIHLTNFDKQEFVLGGKLPTGLEGLGSVFSCFFPLGFENQSTHMLFKWLFKMPLALFHR